MKVTNPPAGPVLDELKMHKAQQIIMTYCPTWALRAASSPYALFHHGLPLYLHGRLYSRNRSHEISLALEQAIRDHGGGIQITPRSVNSWSRMAAARRENAGRQSDPGQAGYRQFYLIGLLPAWCRRGGAQAGAEAHQCAHSGMSGFASTSGWTNHRRSWDQGLQRFYQRHPTPMSSRRHVHPGLQ